MGSESRLVGWSADLGAAVRWAASQQDWAVNGTSKLENGGTRYDLLSQRDEPGYVECRPTGPATDSEHFEGTATASLGRFGNANAERRLVRDIASRLRVIAEKREQSVRRR